VSVGGSTAMGRATGWEENTQQETRFSAAHLRLGFGSVNSDAIHAALQSRPDVLQASLKDGRSIVTTTAVLAEEQDILRHAREGRGQCVRLDFIYKCRDPSLAPEQRAAVGHVLASRDRVTLVAAQAGPQGDVVLRSTIQAIESTGLRVVMLTPTSQGKDGLHQRGFGGAEELRELFGNKELLGRARGQVIWFDSAHQTGRHSLKRIIEATKDLGARIVLSYECDARDSSRGNAIGLLRKGAGLGIGPAIQAGPDQAPSNKPLAKMLDAIEKQGNVREFKWDGQRDAALCKAHAEAIKAGKSVAVFAANANEAERITGLLRAGLREAGKIQGEDVTFGRLVRLGWAEADWRNPKRYQEGQVVQFIRPGGGFAAGTRGVVSRIDAGGEVRVRTERGERALPLGMAARFQVYRSDTLPLAVGDRIRLTQGMRMPDGRLVNSGQPFTVAGFTPTGDIQTTAGRNFPRSIVLHAGYQTRLTDFEANVSVAIGQSAFIERVAPGRYPAISEARNRLFLGLIWDSGHKNDNPPVRKPLQTQRMQSGGFSKRGGGILRTPLCEKPIWPRKRCICLLYRGLASGYCRGLY
jgi:hypothetical protein